jgi:hypothetical protein
MSEVLIRIHFEFVTFSLLCPKHFLGNVFADTNVCFSYSKEHFVYFPTVVNHFLINKFNYCC